jgi:hypothetical protein
MPSGHKKVPQGKSVANVTNYRFEFSMFKLSRICKR